ncbi:MAG: transposase family protein, partial [Proteobacteria bacterium]|nr:transposase family protein [Pseudomonadota bacterium]
MQEFVTSPAFAHFSIRALSWLAKRTSSVFASATTWSRQIKANKWLRPRERLYPAKPKLGIRAITPNQLWHIDVTIVRLVNGAKAYLQAVIDNYSRYVLDWKVSGDISAVNTRDLLLSALAKAKIRGQVGKPEV